MATTQYNSVKRLSWRAAYGAYKATDGKLAVVWLRIFAILLGMNVVDEPLPVIGQIDDPLFPPEIIFVVSILLFIRHQVKKFRQP